jgi:peptidoglycan/LPS O-acetylase OafA/YrhL
MTTVGAAPPHRHDHRIDYLDGWRGLAILLVLQSHFLHWAGIDSGQLGVDAFFCLSGLLMSDILFVRRTPLVRFYKRRISRILPAFALFVVVVFGVAAACGTKHEWLEFLSTLFFLRTYFPAQPDIWSTGLPIGHLWSLNVEEHSYIFLSMLTLLPFLRRREAWVLGAASVISMALYYVYSVTPSMRNASYEIRTEVAASFLLVSAGYFLVRHRVAPWVRPWMPLAAIPVAALGYLPHAHWWVSAVVSPLALAFAVNHLGEAPAAMRRLLAAAPIRLMGVWSYSIYLWQHPFFTYKSMLPTGVAFLGAIGVGLMSYYLLENPCRAWINARW